MKPNSPVRLMLEAKMTDEIQRMYNNGLAAYQGGYSDEVTRRLEAEIHQLYYKVLDAGYPYKLYEVKVRELYEWYKAHAPRLVPAEEVADELRWAREHLKKE